MMTNTKILPLFHLFISLYSLVASASDDILTASQSLSGNETMVSAGQIYQLGLFTPPGADANIFYLGIWFHNLPKKSVVWVANRDSPARNSTVSLKLGTGGQIILAEDGASDALWSTSNQSQATRPILQLLDTGNLVVREDDNENPEDYIWQSFDHPTDTLLPSQKLGWDKKSGLDRHLTSWKSDSDPSSGDYTYELVRTGDPELMVKEGSRVIFRTGPWVGNWLSGVPAMYPSTSLNFTFVDTQEEVTYGFKLKDRSYKFRLTVVPGGTLNRYVWMPERNGWYLYWSFPRDQCDKYELCGPYGVCDGASSQFVCECPKGFEPKNQAEWDLLDGSHGCRRKTSLDCGSDGFRVVGGMKLPMSGAAVVYKDMGLEDCKELCKKNCSCTAYANSEVVDGVGSGCVVWAGELLDMRALGDGGQDLYVRLAASDLGSNKTKKVITGVGVTAGVVLLVIAMVGYFSVKRRHTSDASTHETAPTPRTTERSSDFLLSGIILSNKRDILNKKGRDDLELPLYDFNAMVLATNNFSDKNKLGEGGFGSVYKGVLTEGEEVAVKRLSKDSGQGIEEFKNEVKLIAKLQHRNLVRLLGCCVGSEEKMLLYEYMPNRSLDSILFDMDRSSMLDWERRFNIICGIARGLLYLHHDSRFRIIHRDMKASNILLDSDMNPKISDFGMARIFGDEKEENNTRRVVGTYGYMSPEYAMDGLFSTKSDVFSFGVLVLEIVTGKKNRGFYNSHKEINLLGYVWKMWEEERGLKLVDPSVGDSYSADEVLKCLQLGLLCVQERPEERPNMSSVVTFLGSEASTLPQPKLPGFFFGRRPGETDTSQQDDSISVNQVTVTIVDGR